MKLLTPFFFLSFLFASYFEYAPTGKTKYKLEILAVNDTIDFLNIKDKEISKKYGAIGDSYGAKLTYIKNDNHLTLQRLDIEYNTKKLINYDFNFFKRYGDFGSGIDIGFKYNFSNNLNIKNPAILNALINKLGYNAKINNNGSISYGSVSVSFYDKQGNAIYPYLTFYNMKYLGFYANLFKYKSFELYKALTYIGLRIGKGTMSVGVGPKGVNSFLDDALQKFPNKTLTRIEKMLYLGINFGKSFKKFYIESNLEYNRFFNSKDENYINDNLLLTLILSIPYNRYTFFIGGKIMLHQLITDIPYLYNKYTQTQFDHKYGYAIAGIEYRY